jgi:hypothetical protein
MIGFVVVTLIVGVLRPKPKEVSSAVETTEAEES